MSSSNGSQADIRAPIHRLHVELLISILYDARSQLKDTCLTHVCRSWRSLLFDMPEFWVSTLQQTVIYLGGRPLSEQLKQYLTLSAPRSLRLLISVHSDGWHEREVLRPYASRIVEVVAAVGICGFDNDSEGFMELLKESPNLARLHLELNSGTVKSRLHNYCNDHLSNLPHLHVDFKSLPTPSCANTCLTTLMIEILPYAIPESAAKLRLFQRLNFLTVDVEPVQRWASPETLEVPMLPSSDEEIINLPSLTHLSMRATTSAAICTLYRLRWFHPRACLTLLDLEVSDEHIDLLPIFGAPTVLRQHILPSIVHLYLGRTRKRRHVRLLGYDRSDVVRLEISLWREKRGSSHDVLANILRPFEPFRGIASLAFDLPNLPVALLRGPWG
ncbi:hypothetical protein BC628DRAFT_484576 [Trametes gibbosa]|nr:hypothetical protein BC628DRAFT_484576 [Trametes gibbosa]